MSGEKFRIKSPTIALYEEDGRHVATTIPAGSVVTIDTEDINGNRLVDVVWADKQVMMFAQDIRSRGKKVE